MTAAITIGRPAPGVGSSSGIRLEYCGFRNTEVSREYVLLARLLDDEREYVVAIAHAAFASRRVSFQDGPDICFQRLRRELLGQSLLPLPPLTITEVELAAYRTAHAPVATRRAAAAMLWPAGSEGNPAPHPGIENKAGTAPRT
ncbi:MAG TPA: hypothetical protein VFM88_23655 [Vicinamibacteria bacterium]|nr:hypothetical protein [Vicinamibacteria bacterium]